MLRVIEILFIDVDPLGSLQQIGACPLGCRAVLRFKVVRKVKPVTLSVIHYPARDNRVAKSRRSPIWLRALASHSEVSLCVNNGFFDSAVYLSTPDLARSSFVVGFLIRGGWLFAFLLLGHARDLLFA